MRRSSVKAARLPTDQLVGAAQQHIRRPFGEYDQALRSGRRGGPCSSACARTRTAPRRRARSAASASAPRPALRAATTTPLRSDRPGCSSDHRAPASWRCSPDRQRARLARPPTEAGLERVSLLPDSPSGAYPVPVRSTRPLAVTTVRTVISFLVSVPVLSEAITVAEPSVSTAGSLRTIAWRRAIRCTPSASTAVTTPAGPPGRPRPRAPRRGSAHRDGGEIAHPLDDNDGDDDDRGDDQDDDAEQLAGRSSSGWSGVVGPGFARSPAILPISVCIPVAVTTAVPRP